MLFHEVHMLDDTVISIKCSEILK